MDEYGKPIFKRLAGRYSKGSAIEITITPVITFTLYLTVRAVIYAHAVLPTQGTDVLHILFNRWMLLVHVVTGGAVLVLVDRRRGCNGLGSSTRLSRAVAFRHVPSIRK